MKRTATGPMYKATREENKKTDVHIRVRESNQDLTPPGTGKIRDDRFRREKKHRQIKSMPLIELGPGPKREWGWG